MAERYFRVNLVERTQDGEQVMTTPFDNSGGPKGSVIWGTVALDADAEEAIIKVENHQGSLDYVSDVTRVSEVTETEVEDCYERVHGQSLPFAEIDSKHPMEGQ